MATIQGIYIALFGRPADPTGLAYFNGVTNNGADLSQIGNLAGQAEYLNRFEGLDNVAIVTSIYQALFNRNPELAGLTYFVNELNSGRQTINTIAINILDGAQNADLATVNNKIVAANAFTAAIDTPDELAAYRGDFAANAGLNYLDGITSDAATIPNAAATDAALASIVIGTGIILTEGIDIVSGTVFNAPRGFTPGGTDQVNTLNDDDVLTGTGDKAVLNLSYVTDVDTGDNNILPTLTNIATVNVDVRLDSDATLDLQDSTGIKNLNVSGLDDFVSFTFDNIQDAGGTAGLNLSINKSNADNSFVQFLYDGDAVAGGADVANLTLNDVDIDGVVIDDEDGEDGVGVETANITSKGGTNEVGQFTIEDVVTVKIDGDTSLDAGTKGQVVRPGGSQVESFNYGVAFNNGAGSFTTLDASALKASISVNLGDEVTASTDETSGKNVDFKFTGTAFDDTVRLLGGLDSAGDVINGGDGNDTAQVFNSVTKGSVTSVEALDIRADENAITVDTSIFSDLKSIILRNESNAFNAVSGKQESVAGNAVYTLDKLSVAAAADLKVQHSSTGSDGIAQNVINANLATDTSSDLVGLTIADQVDKEQRGINNDPRFNLTLNAAKVESITLNDIDTESNSVDIGTYAALKGTLKITGDNQDGNFLNLDFFNALRKDQSGGATDPSGISDPGAAAGNRFLGSTLDASTYTGDLIARVSSNVNVVNGGQTITTGKGNDSIFFDAINNTTAGLTISDKVDLGAGNDTLFIDGNGVKINISASEWTNVKNVETLDLVGNGVVAGTTNLASAPGANDAYGKNSYNLTLTNDLITNNGGKAENGDGRTIAIINDNDQLNGVNLPDDLGTALNRGVTIDARTLDAQHNFTYDGEEGTFRTADRFIMSDANINGIAQIDGGAVLAGGSAVNGPSNLANADVLEVRNSAVVTIGDLVGLKNIGSIEFTNDQAATQTAVLQLDNVSVDALVNSSQDASSVATTETLTISAFDNPLVVGARTILNLDATLVTNQFLVLKATGGGGVDTITGGAGNDIIDGKGGADTLNGGAGLDTINGGTGNDTISGGADADKLTGGAGADTFQIGDGESLFNGADTITDFTTASDKIDFASFDGADVATEFNGGALTINQMITQATTTMVNGFNDIVYFFNAGGSGDAFVFSDTDGNGVYDQATDGFLVLTGINTAAEIAPTDFV